MSLASSTIPPRNWSPTCATRFTTSRTTAAYSSISPMVSNWSKYTMSSHSLSAPTCCLSSNSVLTVRKMRSPTLSRRYTNSSPMHSTAKRRKCMQACQRLYHCRSIEVYMQRLKSILQAFIGDQWGPGSGGKLSRKGGVVETNAVGCAILEFVKLVMYDFYYDCLMPTFGDRLHLCFTDTDSFICHVQS